MKVFILWISAKDKRFPFVGVFSTFEKALKGAEIYKAESLKQEPPSDYWLHLEICEMALNDAAGCWIQSTNVQWKGEKAITWRDTLKPNPRPEWLVNFEEHREELGFGPPDQQ